MSSRLISLNWEWFLPAIAADALEPERSSVAVTRTTDTYHGCSSRRLVHLVLGGLDLGLQVSRRVEVLALLPRAAALYVVHAHSDRVVVGVNHRAVWRMGEATVVLPARAVTPLVLPTYLVRTQKQHKRTHAFTGLALFFHQTMRGKHLARAHYEVTVHFAPRLMKQSISSLVSGLDNHFTRQS